MGVYVNQDVSVCQYQDADEGGQMYMGEGVGLDGYTCAYPDVDFFRSQHVVVFQHLIADVYRYLVSGF